MHARFAPVRDCFHDLLAGGRETGAGLTVWYDGRPVVELVGGGSAGRQFAPDTLVDVYSVGKPVAALCLLMLVERGRVDLDAPVSTYWPGFRAPATVRQVLSHTAGLPAFPVMAELPGPPNWLNPNVPSSPAGCNCGNSSVACRAAPSAAQCPAVRTTGRPAGSKAESPVEQISPVSAKYP